MADPSEAQGAGGLGEGAGVGGVLRGILQPDKATADPGPRGREDSPIPGGRSAACPRPHPHRPVHLTQAGLLGLGPSEPQCPLVARAEQEPGDPAGGVGRQ